MTYGLVFYTSLCPFYGKLYYGILFLDDFKCSILHFKCDTIVPLEKGKIVYSTITFFDILCNYFGMTYNTMAFFMTHYSMACNYDYFTLIEHTLRRHFEDFSYDILYNILS